MRSKLVLTALLVVMLMASLATPLAVAERPEDEEQAAAAALEAAGPAAAPVTTAPSPAAPAPDDVLYFWDFEADDGGFAPTLDWGWGEYAWNGATCDPYTNYPPPAAYSGTHMWGTVLDSCYVNYGNNSGYDTCVNGNPADDSILSYTIDLTAITGTIELSWWEWYDLFMDWDWAEVYANEDVVFQHCGGGFVAPTGWVQQVADLTPYAGDLVTLEFHMMASTVVNHAGWYLDDVMVTTDVPPAPPDIIDVTYLANGLEVAFDATVEGSPPIAYAWDFGDGTGSDAEDPVHVYPEAECYTAALTVTNPWGEDGWADAICLCEPVAGVDFTWEPEIGIVGQPIMFYGSVMTGTEPFVYTWDFGDGGTWGGQDATHVYTETGIYTVTLFVDNCGNTGSDMVEHVVTVEAAEMRIFLPILLKSF